MWQKLVDAIKAHPHRFVALVMFLVLLSGGFFAALLGGLVTGLFSWGVGGKVVGRWQEGKRIRAVLWLALLVSAWSVSMTSVFLIAG